MRRRDGLQGATMNRPAGAFLAVALALGGCGKRGSPGQAGAAPGAQAGQTAAPAVPFEVRQGSADLLYFWFDERGAAHPAERMEEVPAANRERVRVEPTRQELRAPGWVFLTDLRAPGA